MFDIIQEEFIKQGIILFEEDNSQVIKSLIMEVISSQVMVGIIIVNQDTVDILVVEDILVVLDNLLMDFILEKQKD